MRSYQLDPDHQINFIPADPQFPREVYDSHTETRPAEDPGDWEIPAPDGPLLVIADTHGYLECFEGALREGLKRAEGYRERMIRDAEGEGRDTQPIRDAPVTVVALGDFVDNGPQIPELVERVTALWEEGNSIETAKERGFFFYPIMGNHDIGMVLSMDQKFGTPLGPPGFYLSYLGYHKVVHSAHQQYAMSAGHVGKIDHEVLKASVPERHRNFLGNLPWYWKVGHYLFVHAGLFNADVYSAAEQMRFLRQRDISALRGDIPLHMRMKAEARRGKFPPENDPRWEVVVVTGHNRYPEGNHQIASHRLGLHAAACQGEGVGCALLPPGIGKGGFAEGLPNYDIVTPFSPVGGALMDGKIEPFLIAPKVDWGVRPGRGHSEVTEGEVRDYKERVAAWERDGHAPPTQDGPEA